MAKIDRAALLQRIREIDGLSNDERSALIELLNTHKKYGLVWENKPEDVEERLREELPVLVEDVDKRIINDTEDEKYPNHILIEGDNLEALTALSYTHEGKIDVIYIDPPYNTGKKDFVYNDSFVDKEDAYRHSKWLSFMAKRLKIAKRLLSDKGAIFISIDDNEQANIKLLCDEIFGESHFIANFCRATGTTTGQDANKIGSSFDYCLYYSKSDNFILNGIPLAEKDLKRFKEKDEKGNYSTLQLRKTGNSDTKEDRPNMFYPIEAPDGSLVYPFGPTGYLSRWRVAKDTYEEWKKQNLIVWKANDNDTLFEKDGYKKSKWTPYVKYYLEGRTKQVSNLIQDIEGNKKASLTLKEIFGSKGVFDNPKPIELITLLETISSSKSSTILDFFAGSGTTMHATMQLNAEDGGSRQCIMVTNNENNICEDITYERNKRVINGYITNGIKVEGLHKNNLRYFRTNFISRERTNSNMRQLVSLATDMLCIKENIYAENEQKSFGTLKLKSSVARYFASRDKKMLVIYNEDAIERLVEEIETMQLDTPINVYLFSPGRYAFDDSFEFVADKVKLCALPAAIYDAYQKVLPKKKDKLLPEFENNDTQEDKD